MKLHIIETGYFKLDGGAMFGIVPKSMWNKINPADNNNMCTWSMRCLLIEEGDRKILIDTGMGPKQDEKFRSHFYPHGKENITDSLQRKGFSAEDITDVFLTHFHFDHVGGALYNDSQGNTLTMFPNATYWSNEVHYKWAMEPNAREKASFLKENFVPLKERNCLKFIDVEEGVQFTDHIKVRFVYGHTEAMMLPEITLPDGKRIIFTAALLPSAGHVRMPYVMAYDLRPLVTLDEKASFYEQILDKDTFIFFEHDPVNACGQLTRNERGRYGIDAFTTLAPLGFPS